MDTNQFNQRDETCWEIRPTGAMRVPAIIYADAQLLQNMDQKVYEQITNVATLPGIVEAAYAMPDAHWGYGFPIGVSLRSIRNKVAWCRLVVWVLIFPAVFAPCIPD